MTDETTDTAEMSDDQFEAYLDTEDAAAESEINAQDSAELGDDDDSPTNLHAGLTLSDADRDDVGGVDEDLPEIPLLTDDQLELDQFRRERDARTKTFSERCEDMDRGRSFGEIRAAAVWARNEELERRADVAAASPDAEAANEARAVANVAAYMQAEDDDPGPGIIDPGENDAAEAAQNRRNAMANWDDFCNDPDS